MHHHYLILFVIMFASAAATASDDARFVLFHNRTGNGDDPVKVFQPRTAPRPSTP